MNHDLKPPPPAAGDRQAVAKEAWRINVTEDSPVLFARACASDPSRRFRLAPRGLIVAIAALAVAACASTQEYPLAPNMVRIDVEAPAAPLVGDTTLRRAAELTLRNGYSAFRLDPIYVEAFDHFGVTVVMFHAGDPRAEGAFDAADILKRSSW